MATHGKPTAQDQFKRMIYRVNEYVGYCECLSVCFVIYIHGLHICSSLIAQRRTRPYTQSHNDLDIDFLFVDWCIAHAFG